VCYSDSEVGNDYPDFGPYKILFRKYAKVHGRNLERDIEELERRCREAYSDE
jgi:hypothetical protein